MIETKEISLPDFGRPEQIPSIPPAIYATRLEEVQARMEQHGLDILVVYADREHAANMAYLTTFDPRFEEALLLLSVDGHRLLLAGNECHGYPLPDGLGIDIELFQDFSLMGQPRDSSRTLRQIVADFGLIKGKKVGCIGWKTQSSSMIGLSSDAIEIPTYLTDLLRELSGDKEQVVNANDILMGNADGLRIINEPEQIAFFEYAAVTTSEAMLRFFETLRVGIRENEAAAVFNPRGLPLSCHTMTSFGEKARYGLASPADNSAQPGIPFSAAFGVSGSLTARAGVLAASMDDLAPDIRDYYQRFVYNYFLVVATWYEAIKVGATAGDVYDKAEKARDPEVFTFALNPGHFIHLDEWTNSPFCPGSKTVLQSGMAIQADIIPLAVGPWCVSNMEDGIVLADSELRVLLADQYPEMWLRIQARREFMISQLGIQLDESVLPMSNMPAWLPPFALDRKTVLTKS